MKDSKSSVVEGSVKTVEAEVPSTESVEESVGVEAILEELVRHRVEFLAPWLSDKPPPAWWEGSPAEWTELVTAAREGKRPEALSWIVENVRLGWTLRERLADRLTPGSKEVAGGEVRRPAQGEVSDFLLGRAIQLKNQLGAGGNLYDRLPAQLQINLENAATRTQHELQAAVDAAEGILEKARLAKEAKFTAEAGKVHVRVFAVAGPSRRYTPGDYQLTAAEVEELQEWSVRVESQAAGRSLASLGHSRWPAYEMLEGE